ncbi:hypothetical protein DK941_06770 [Shigella flexneri]|nr:hypothetical protein [Shigella flexneri]
MKEHPTSTACRFRPSLHIPGIHSSLRQIQFHGARCLPYSHSEIGNDSNLLIVFYVQIMPDDFVMQLHRF